MKSRIKPSMIKSQSSKIGMETPLKNPQFKEFEMENTRPAQSMSGRSILTGKLQQAPTYNRKRKELIGSDKPIDGTKSSQDTERLKGSSETRIPSVSTNSSLMNKFKGVHKEVDTNKERRPPEDLMRTSTVETATVSGQMLDEHLGRHQHSNLITYERDSCGPYVMEGDEREIHSKDSYVTTIRRASNDKLKSVAYSEDRCSSFESSGTWIFPVEGRPLCVTTGGKQVMDLIGGCSS
ncbi:hypothetical protein L1049_022770 [Liquidambar formosana]|uniref:Uncharacterized protein n=1 Tax=Liquidambar formosana TaxID=63359 RepID=A0AAP0RF19_LIQFO